MISLHESVKPRIAITMGDPCGVGPEILVKALKSEELVEVCSPLVIGDPLALHRAVDLLGAGLKLRTTESITDIKAEDLLPAGVVQILSPARLSPEDIPYGRPTEASSRAVVRFIETAVQLALSGDVQGICTCPINKAHLHRHGFSFPGHTEFLQDLTNAEYVVMMLAGPKLRVSLVSIHNAIAEVPKLLTRERLFRTIRITGEALMRDLGLKSARIGVAGLNPHAGEEGRFGREEIELIQPVIETFVNADYRVNGPFPPDTLFHRAYQGEFDAVVAMYHDQGLIPVKLVHFYEAVNVTLGLPIIRTSVDHGTAYDLAGTGRADPGSLKAAVGLAAFMAHNRSKAG